MSSTACSWYVHHDFSMRFQVCEIYLPVQLREIGFTDEKCFFNHTQMEKRVEGSGLYEKCFLPVADYDSPGGMNGPLEAAIACCLALVRISFLIQCSPLKRPSVKRPSVKRPSVKRPSVKRPSRLIGHFSQLPNDQFTSNLPG